MELIEAAVRNRDLLIEKGPLTGQLAVVAQALKLTEEAGELAEAMLGVLGQNPRKGVCKTTDDVLNEAIDVILTAAVLAVWIEGGPAFAARLAERLPFLVGRLESL